MSLNIKLLAAVFGCVLCCSVALSYAASMSIPLTMPEKVPEEFIAFLPKEVTDFYNSLTESEKGIMKEMAENHAKYPTEKEAMDELKTKSEKLWNKAGELRMMLDTKINALTEGARTFVNTMITKVKALKPQGTEKPNLIEIRKKANEIMNDYKALPDTDKDSLKEQFPKITSVIQNEKFQKMAQGLLKTSEAAAAPAA